MASMSSGSPDPHPCSGPPEPPPLPSALVEPSRVIAVGALAWLVVGVLAFTVPGLESWRPICVAGLATGVVGTSIFLWQRAAARRGARGAQIGLTIPEEPDT